MKHCQNLKSKILPALILWMLYLSACSDVTEKAQPPVGNPPPILKQHRVEYGIDCDGLNMVKDRVQPHQNLSDILIQHNVPNSAIHDAALESKAVFDVRTMKAGNPFCIIRSTDSSKKVRYFVYELNPVDYVVFDFDDPIKVSLGKKPVQLKTKTVTGRIESSLWDTLTEQQLDIELAIKLSEIYAWAIDFHHLQKDDTFRVIFEEKFVKEKPIGIGKIKASRFDHKDKTFYAFYFEQDAHGSYYDQHADSMEKAFLKAPIKFSRITSGFSKRRFHPVLKKYKAHFGIDYAAKTGTPIMSTGDGVVLKAGYDKNNGKYVKIRHNGVYSTQYLHMSRFAPGIKRGRNVRQGEIIGSVGSTGLATGPHLCYRFWKNGRQVNPSKEDIPSLEPVGIEHLDRFNQQMANLKQQLDILDMSGVLAIPHDSEPADQ
ncbi:MAG: peptidoglycan DD-metalloendopeptidase family protein [Deltaproteobacteria bacterium]|nr:peptidoglycan DD-metalloendopeptidase family protein [Deltaproteobacteria bacterium]MBW2196397.1 peptidoglycan DD-metalloendopeptidase family protein [Deltaproteobacteria bacterium]MBW2225946.1 peptidoglycan DD-metalloendopeptidase family protein [Deltaproteobacteria bacterium]MBW2326387.1 peptidoglycan DD-metalloendopeptidase family protein [Deltaproteobacteria bacterium]